MKRLLLLLFLFAAPASAQVGPFDTNAWYIPNGGFANVPGAPYADSPGICVDSGQVDATSNPLNLNVINASNVCPGGASGPATLPLKAGVVMWRTMNMLYGTVEIKAKLTGVGAHGTVWLYDAARRPTVYISAAPGGTPAQEIDIAEGVPFVYSNTTTLRQNSFVPSGNNTLTTTVTDYSTNFHDYKIVWTPAALTWYVDGLQTNKITTNVPYRPMFVIMDIEAADAGAGDVNPANFPQVQQVNFVRAWNQAGTLIFDDEFNGSPAFQNALSVQLEAYNCSTIENPLSDGGNFTGLNDTIFVGTIQAITGNLCEPVATSSTSGTFWSGAVVQTGGTWPADQFTELTLTKITLGGNTSICDLVVRAAGATTGTYYLASLQPGASAGTGVIVLFGIVGNTQHSLITYSSQTIQQGDVYRLTVTGNVLTVSRNGTVTQTFTDTNNYVPSAGSPGFSLRALTAITNTQTGLWAAGANQAAPPTFTPNGGTYQTTQTVTISSSTAGGTIFYTTDGTTPTHSSSSISNGSTISVSASETVKAFESASAFADSGTSTAVYTITGTRPGILTGATIGNGTSIN